MSRTAAEHYRIPRIAVTRRSQRDEIAPRIEPNVFERRTSEKTLGASDQDAILLDVELSEDLGGRRLRGEGKPGIGADQRGVMSGVVLEHQRLVIDLRRRTPLLLG